MTIRSIILAAGQGTRMNSKIPKVLHPLLGQPLIKYSIETAKMVTGEIPVLVVGHAREHVLAEVGSLVEVVVQEQQLGTGHAVRMAKPILKDQADLVLVTYADMPLLKPETLAGLIEAQQAHTGPLTMLTVEADDPRGFGRIVRTPDGQVRAIIEEAQVTQAESLIRELNPGVYCFDAEWLWNHVDDIPISPKGEYYLTDLVGMVIESGLQVQAIKINDSSEAVGINTRVHLSEAEAILRRRVNEAWMLAGVTLVDPASTYIEAGVTIGQDTVIWPNSYLQGTTAVGEGCTIGPNTMIIDTRIGHRCKIVTSVLEGAILEDEVEMGPFGHLREGAHLATGVHMGNFGEVKKSYLGPGVKMGHFSYIGDATIGENVNIGAGTITCNFDGKKKNPTRIGANAFIGSDTMLVAPLELGEGARTGAGAVVTKNIPSHSLAVGMPARVIRKLEK